VKRSSFQGVERALIVLALRESAWHVLHYGSAVALQFLRQQFSQFQPVAAACSGLINMLQKDGRSAKSTLRHVDTTQDCASWKHLEEFAQSTMHTQRNGLVILDAAAHEQAYVVISHVACVPVHLQLHDMGTLSAEQVPQSTCSLPSGWEMSPLDALHLVLAVPVHMCAALHALQ
jgi:hypothetical protein